MYKYLSLILVLTGLISSPSFAQSRFENITASLNITHRYTGGWEFFVGGGVASFDCDGDLFPELFVAGGAGSATLLRNNSGTVGHDIVLTSETPPELRLTNVTGSYPLDIDSDGILDLFIMRVGQNILLKGDENCRFSEFGGILPDTGNRWTTAFSATWESGQKMPSLAIGNYVNRDNPEGPFEACDTNYLMRPANGGYTTTQLVPGHCPLSMLFSDWGRNGRQDLRVSNDRHYYVSKGREQLWAMEEKPRLFDKDDGWQDFSIWGMGIASRDISGDGLPEVFLTSMGDQKLQSPAVDKTGPAFADATFKRGTTAHRPYTGGDGRPSTGWHVEFGDVDNNGLDDVFIAKGNVEQMPGAAMADPNNLLMQQGDGTFTEDGLAAGISSLDRSRGAALVDLNLDGLLDLVVVNRMVPIEILQNVSGYTGHWLLLDINQNEPNRNAVGGWVEVNDGARTWHREITIGGGHAGGSSGLMHFGLGAARVVQVRVIWPDGKTSEWIDQPVNQIVRLTRSGQSLAVSRY